MRRTLNLASWASWAILISSVITICCCWCWICRFWICWCFCCSICSTIVAFCFSSCFRCSSSCCCFRNSSSCCRLRCCSSCCCFLCCSSCCCLYTWLLTAASAAFFSRSSKACRFGRESRGGSSHWTGVGSAAMLSKGSTAFSGTGLNVGNTNSGSWRTIGGGSWVAETGLSVGKTNSGSWRTTGGGNWLAETLRKTGSSNPKGLGLIPSSAGFAASVSICFNWSIAATSAVVLLSSSAVTDDGTTGGGTDCFGWTGSSTGLVHDVRGSVEDKPSTMFLFVCFCFPTNIGKIEREKNFKNLWPPLILRRIVTKRHCPNANPFYGSSSLLVIRPILWGFGQIQRHVTTTKKRDEERDI